MCNIIIIPLGTSYFQAASRTLIPFELTAVIAFFISSLFQFLYFPLEAWAWLFPGGGIIAATGVKEPDLLLICGKFLHSKSDHYVVFLHYKFYNDLKQFLNSYHCSL